MIKTNYHTHSNFCDGKDFINDIVETAIQKDFKIIGFSSHSIYPFASSWHIAPREHKNYIKEINDAKNKFEGKIEILSGFEADFIPGLSKPDFETYKSFSPDYLIGSVHYVITQKGRLCVDYPAEKLRQKIDELFSGNTKKLTCEYFALQREMLKNGNFTILAHSDLIRKNNEKLNLFNENDSWYRQELKALAEQASKSGVIAEINTGGLARKTINSVYPSQELLSLFAEKNVPITFSSDCHSKENLDFAFDIAKKEAIKAGYKEVAVIKKGGKIDFQKILN